MQAQTNHSLQAALLVLSAMMLFGLIDNFMRLAAQTGGLWQFHLIRSVVALLTLGLLAKIWGIRLKPLRPSRVLARSLLTSVAMVIYFGCLGFMPIAQVVAGLFTAPIFVVIYSAVLFGEQVGLRRIFAVLIGFSGAVLALGSDMASVDFWVLVPVLAGAIYGLGNIATRTWCAGEGAFTLLGGFFGCVLVWGILGVALLWIYPLPVLPGVDGFLTRGWVRPEGMFLFLCVLQGFGSLFGVGLTIRAYQLADATMVAVFENLLLVFATIWAVILWNEVPTVWQAMGLGLIVLAGIIIAVRSPVPTQIRAVGIVE